MNRRSVIIALCTLAVIALLTKTDPDSAHEYSRFGTVESLVERGTFRLDDSSFIGTIDKIYRDGHYYSHQPPLLSVIEAPVYWAISLPGIRFDDRGRHVMTYLFTLLTNGLALASTVVVFAWILALGGVESANRGIIAGLLVLSTWLLPYGLVSSSHGISALLLTIAIWLLMAVAWHGFTPARGLALGAALGLLSVIELVPLFTFVPLIVMYLASRRDLHAGGWSLVALGVAVPLAAHAIFNVSITGDVIPAGFHHELFDYPGSVFDEASLTGTIKYDSLTAAVSYGWMSLFAGKGFFTLAPILLVSLIVGFIEWRWWDRARGVHLVLLGGTLLSLGAVVLTTNNYGGQAVGFRHAVFVIPALITLLLPWVADRRSWRWRITIVVACLSLAIMLTLAIVKPWSNMSWSQLATGTWDQYVPIVARIVNGDLLHR